MSGKWGYSHILIPEWARGSESGLGTRTRCLFPPAAWSLTWRTVMSSSLNLCETSWAAGMAAHGEDSSPSAFSFMPPVLRTKVSNRSKGCTLSLFGSLTFKTISAGASSLDIAFAQYAPVFIPNLQFVEAIVAHSGSSSNRQPNNGPLRPWWWTPSAATRSNWPAQTRYSL